MSMFNSVSSDQATFATGTNIKDMMSNLNAKSSTATTSAVAGDTVSISSDAAAIVAKANEDSGETSMLATNFVSATKGQSEYVAATKSALTTRLSMQNTKTDAVSSSMEDVMSGLQNDIETQAKTATAKTSATSSSGNTASTASPNAPTNASGVAASGGGANAVEVSTAAEENESAPSSGSVDVVV